MVLLNVILAILFPLAPVAQLIEGVRHVLACFVRGFEDPDYLEELRGDYAQLAELDRVIADMESILHIVIWYMARFKLGLPYREHRRTGRARPGNRLTLEKVQARLQRACQMLSDLERMAVRRAWRLKRLLDAHPLGLIDHRPASTTILCTTILGATIPCISPTTIPGAGASGESSTPIRAPPSTRQFPKTQPNPTRRRYLRERLCTPFARRIPTSPPPSRCRTRRMDFPVKFWSIAPTLFHELKSTE